MVPTIGLVVVGGALWSGVVALGLASYLYRHRSSPGVGWFMGSLLAISGWCLSYGTALLVFAFPLRAHLTALALGCAIWTGPLFLLFAIGYTGRDATVGSRWTASTLAVPAVGTVLLATYPAHSLLWRQLRLVRVAGLAAVDIGFQPLAYLITGYTLVSTLVAVLLLVETIVSYGPLYRREAVAVALSAVPPAAGAVLWLLKWGPTTPLNLAPTLFVLHLALDSYAFVGRDMFESNPATRRAAERSMVDDIGTPVFALDPDGRVVTVNDATVDLVGRDREELLGDPLEAILGVDAVAAPDQESITMEGDGPDRQFTVVTAPLTDPAGTDVGQTVILQEVTQEREREQRLDVLNRVIRHNLRNEMTVVLGQAERIARLTDDAELQAAARKILDSADRLLATGDKAREFEQIRGEHADDRAVDMAALIADVAEEVRESFPGASVEVAASPMQVTTDPRVLRLVLSSLLENALVHNDTDAPVAVVTVGDEGPDVDICISDNGPGIDPDELAPIRRGAETDLVHSTGIGLWVASWGMTKLGGDIEFTTSEAGTDVRLRLPQPDRSHSGRQTGG